ncbi:hypothetical protein HanIR_Chr16g0817571 [Helianthus annuus]|nr:hypothetical protein HanIR_Chr16g0817571 [Helianthus annuus]
MGVLDVILSAKQSMRCRKWMARQSYQYRFVKISLMILHFRGRYIVRKYKNIRKFEKTKNMIKLKKLSFA